MRTVFLGSGEFSRDLLAELIQAGFGIDAVITRPDRPAGRGLSLRPTPVKVHAQEEGMRVLQPAGPSDPAFMGALEELLPDLLLVADYGYLLPGVVLAYPGKGCVNVHPSLLPRYRGAAPIQRALLQGEKETGVTLMVLDEGMDTGAVIATEKISIEDEDDALSLRHKLASLGARMVVETLPIFSSGSIVPRPQDEEMATYADPIRKEETAIDWTRGAKKVHDQVRALSPRPGAYTRLRGKRVKILRAHPREDIGAAAPGEIALARGEELVVGTGEHALQLDEVQPEGKRTMQAGEFLRGYRPREGEILGEASPR